MEGTCFPRMKDAKTVPFQSRILWGLLKKFRVWTGNFSLPSSAAQQKIKGTSNACLKKYLLSTLYSTNNVTWRLCPRVPTLTILLQGAPARWNMAGKVLPPFMTTVLLNHTDTNTHTTCVSLVTIPKLNSSQMGAFYICMYFFSAWF